VGQQEKKCNDYPCSTSSSITASPTSTYSPTSSITAVPSDPTAVLHNTYFILSGRGCRYSRLRIAKTVKVFNKLGCTSICARDSECVAFNINVIEPSDSNQSNLGFECEIIAKDHGSNIDLPSVSGNCKNYERVTV
jgi:hypothetical protein